MKTQKECLLVFLTFSFLTAFLLPLAQSQTSSTVVAITPSAITTNVGQTVSVNITISDVNNLYGVDITLDWNPSILMFSAATPSLGVETYPEGVLHTPINLVQNNLTDSGEYRLIATTIAPGAAFYGGGVLAVVTFKVTGSGSSPLTLTSELADYNPQGSEDITHTDQSGSINTGTFTSPTPTGTATPTSTQSSTSPTTTPINTQSSTSPTATPISNPSSPTDIYFLIAATVIVAIVIIVAALLLRKSKHE